LNRKHQEEVEKIKSFYDTVYYKDVAGQVTPTLHQQRLVRKLRVEATSSVLDVACGTGGFLAACQQRGASIAGVDLSEVAIASCRSNLPQGDFYACSAEKLPFENGQFDLVTCLGSLEHFLEPVEALREMVRVAKPRATFVLLVPNKDFLTRRLGLYGGTYQVDAREEVRTLQEWSAIFEAGGLAVNDRWKDLHVLSWDWISSGKPAQIPMRALQAAVLPLWPLAWQYQVYHLATAR
jgi:ubiquinone/menaquinone biosynthesis C-methylase UbiE